MGDRQERHSYRIKRVIFRWQMLLVIVMTGFLTVAGVALSLFYEGQRLDENLQNVAEALAGSSLLQGEMAGEREDNGRAMEEYLRSMERSLANIDVISVVDAALHRRYHTNPELTGTEYDGSVPEFVRGEREFYAESGRGPSGRQRRAYAAVYSAAGEYLGFVIAVMLRQNILRTTVRILLWYLLAAAAVIGVAALTSVRLSERIKRQLLGYEPDAFRAMFRVRDNILEALEEGILAIDDRERILYANQAARRMLKLGERELTGLLLAEVYPASHLGRVLQTGEREWNVRMRSFEQEDILSDRIPVTEDGRTVGAVGIFRNRTEYTRLMEDLSGVRYLVDSMRANNHDFTNKLHVILGLIQMGRYEDAVGYIMNISMVQRETIHTIMEAIEEPSVAALLIGKHARASELDIRFTLKSGSSLSKSRFDIPSGALVTILGNLLDNAMDALNEKREPPKELTVGIFEDSGAMLITVDDTGEGIPEEVSEHIFENGFSTKGQGRGTGLYLVNGLVQTYGGQITEESEPGAGTSFTVSFTRRETGEPAKEGDPLCMRW